MSYEEFENLHDDNTQGDDGFGEKEPEPEPAEQLTIVNEIKESFIKDLKNSFDWVNESTLPTTDYIKNVVLKSNINKDFKIVWLPLNSSDGFAYNDFRDRNKIFMFSIPDDELKKWVAEAKKTCGMLGYNTEKITVENKNIATLTHEEGHLVLLKKVRFKGGYPSFDELLWVTTDYRRFIAPQFNWNTEENVYKLMEMVAEDYRLIKGGDQASLPSRYFLEKDIKDPEYRKTRLYILKRILLGD